MLACITSALGSANGDPARTLKPSGTRAGVAEIERSSKPITVAWEARDSGSRPTAREAEAEGSRSTSIVRWVDANAAARAMADVVFPTPPLPDTIERTFIKAY